MNSPFTDYFEIKPEAVYNSFQIAGEPELKGLFADHMPFGRPEIQGEQLYQSLNDDNFLHEAEQKENPQVPARPSNVYLTVNGQKQGQIRGNVTRKDLEGSIAIYQIHHEITSPRDLASLAATGRRIHKPVVVTKEVDMASVKLMKALVSNESLKEVIINFYKSAGLGKNGSGEREVNYYRIKLTNAVITKISHDSSSALIFGELKHPLWERIEFIYHKIEWNYLADGGGSASDDLNALKELEFYGGNDEITWENMNNGSAPNDPETEGMINNIPEVSEFEYQLNSINAEDELEIDDNFLNSIERELLQQERSALNNSVLNILDNEVSFYDKITAFFKQTSFNYPIEFIKSLSSKEKNETFLTNLIFFSKHPERNGMKDKRLKKNEKKLIREWLFYRRVFVRPLLLHLLHPTDSITKLSDNDLYYEIPKLTKTWIYAYITALDNFKLITETATDDELNELKGISPSFILEVDKEIVDLSFDIVEDFPVLGKFVKIGSKLVDIYKLYQERQEKYKELKTKNDLINFIVEEKVFFVNLTLTLDANAADNADLIIPMMAKAKDCRIFYESRYLKAKQLVHTNGNVLFRRVCVKWSRQYAAVLRIVFNQNLNLISLKLENVPFGEQIISKMKHSSEGLNLEEFKVTRLIVFYPISIKEPDDWAHQKGDIYFEIIKNWDGSVSGNVDTWRRGALSERQVTDDILSKARKLASEPLPIVH